MGDSSVVSPGISVVEDAEKVGSILECIPSTAYRIPSPDSRIFKDECTYCFNTPFFPGGLFICLKTFTCYCEKHAKTVAERTSNKLYLLSLSRRSVVEEPGEPCSKVKRLAIGVEDGFCNDKMEVEDEHFLVVYPELASRIPLNLIADLPLGVACSRIATTTSAERLEMLQGASNAWDGELKVETKHVNLQQVENPRKLPPSGWVCDQESCGLSENLWLNLTDGSILCGRSQFISENVRSKGNNHARMHFEKTGHPLAVKLGTIEKSGAADIFSYDEDNSVIDTNLAKHLAHFGLRIEDMKSTLELELDINQKWEWARCQEDGENLENVYGPGYTGLINIGSSCYMNSVLQTLLQVPDFVDRFAKSAPEIFTKIDVAEMHDNFMGQTAKLFSALMSEDYSKENSEFNGIKPTQFKRVAARGNAEFTSARQQDAEEYIRYLLEKVQENTAAGEADPSVALRFKVETRLVDNASGRARYTTRDESLLSLPVPKSELVPVDNEAKRFSVSMAACLASAFGESHIEGFKSPMTQETKGATSSIRMVTFPDFLVVQIQKFTVAEDLATKKLDLELGVDDELDLEGFRGKGPQDGEQLLPEDDNEELPGVDPAVVQQLEPMGFSHNACLRAVMETKNSGVEAALEWIMNHSDDPNIHAPVRAAAPSQQKSAISEFSVQQLLNFGFTNHQARYALGKEPEVNAAAEWLFSHSDEIPSEEEVARAALVETTTQKSTETRDGPGRYRLVGFITHMGSSPHSGHYVAHILRDGHWVLFNDEKVAFSKSPPKSLAYLYLYQRM